MCVGSARSATSSGGSNNAAAITKTHDEWSDDVLLRRCPDCLARGDQDAENREDSPVMRSLHAAGAQTAVRPRLRGSQSRSSRSAREREGRAYASPRVQLRSRAVLRSESRSSWSRLVSFRVVTRAAGCSFSGVLRPLSASPYPLFGELDASSPKWVSRLQGRRPARAGLRLFGVCASELVAGTAVGRGATVGCGRAVCPVVPVSVGRVRASVGRAAWRGWP